MSVKEYYEQYWQDGRLDGCPHIVWKKDILLSDVQIDLNGCIYDYGCGNGEIGGEFVNKCKVYGFDISSVALDNAKARGLLSDADYHGKYDVVFLLDILEHLFDIDDIMGIVLDRVKEGGNIYISVPNGVNLYNRLMFLMGNPVDLNDRAHKYNDMWSEHIRVFTLKVLRELCRVNGLRIVKEWYYFPHKLTEKSGLIYSCVHKAVNFFRLHQVFPSLFALGFMVKCIKK